MAGLFNVKSYIDETQSGTVQTVGLGVMDKSLILLFLVLGILVAVIVLK